MAASSRILAGGRRYCGVGIEPLVPGAPPGVVMPLWPRRPPRCERVAGVVEVPDGDIVESRPVIVPLVPIVVPSPAVPGFIVPVVLPGIVRFDPGVIVAEPVVPGVVIPEPVVPEPVVPPVV